MSRYVRSPAYVAADVVALTLAAYLSYVLRLESIDLTGYWSGLAGFAALALIVTLIVFWLTGMYARYWRYASIEELLVLTGSVTTSVVLSGSVILLIDRLLPGMPDDFVVPRSVPLIFLLVALAFTAGPRFTARLLAERGHRPAGMPSGQPVLIMGAGDAGAMIVREMQHNPQLGLLAVGFVDDDPRKQRLRIHNVPVLGNRYDLPRLVERYQARQVIIAMPTAPGKTIRELVAICEQAHVQTRIMPGIYELLDGRVSVNQLRDVEIEDLLRREPVRTDMAAIGELLRGKRVLVTGGGGSIGSELCRQIVRFEPAELIILGRGENSVFEIYQELSAALMSRQPPSAAGRTSAQSEATCHLATAIGDIRSWDRMWAVFEQHQPELVFHAAAHKHVPMMELNPAEAISNNVLGTQNLLNVAMAHQVQRFVMISTDKAVSPTSVMGASKRVAELLVHRAALVSQQPYLAVRFGNVLGSRGSVVPIFKKQIAAGGPVTVTHPDMRRYFMTIPEAVQLVLQAAVLGSGGEVFVLDMGEPVRIVDLARDLVELSGLELGRDIDIVFVGARPGEKLSEDLFIPGEHYERTRHQKILIASNASRLVPANLDDAIQGLATASQRNDAAAIIRILQELIPEYQPGQVTQVPSQ